jgi:hypothetical protein
VKPTEPGQRPSVSRPSSVRLPPSSVWRGEAHERDAVVRGAAP